jgi:hypothetical protein
MRVGFVVMAIIVTGLLANPSLGQEKKAVKLKVLVHPNATLEINGSKTTQKGPERFFEMPAQETGFRYKIDFLIGIGGQKIRHAHAFFHGKDADTITVDLRKVVKTQRVAPLTGLSDLLKALQDTKIKSAAAFGIERKALEAFKNAKGESDDAKLLRDPATLVLLRKSLSDDEAGVRSNVARALGHMGPLANSALPELERLSKKDPSPMVRDAANDALRSIR